LFEREKKHIFTIATLYFPDAHAVSMVPFLSQNPKVLAVPGSLDKKEGRRFHLLLSKRLHLLPPFFV
jgi:hypothetical protein